MNKILKKYLDDVKIAVHHTTKEEIEHLFSIVERDLHDAKVSGFRRTDGMQLPITQRCSLQRLSCMHLDIVLNQKLAIIG